MDECKLCEEMTKKILEENPERKGYALCMDCYEKSKEYVVYVNLNHMDVELGASE